MRQRMRFKSCAPVGWALEGRRSVGHPVDVASGVLFHDFEDHRLAGRVPLVFGRHYRGDLIGRKGALGPSSTWTSM